MTQISQDPELGGDWRIVEYSREGKPQGDVKLRVGPACLLFLEVRYCFKNFPLEGRAET